MNNKIIIAIAVAAVVVVGGIGIAFMLSDDEEEVTYHGNGYKTSDGKDSITSIGDTTLGPVFISDMELYNWNTKADGSGTYVDVYGKIPSGITDLYAQWVNSIRFIHSSQALDDHYKHISVSTKSTIQGSPVTKDLGHISSFDYSYNGTGTEITFTTDEQVSSICVEGSNVLFCYEDGTYASLMNMLTGIEVVESHVSGKSATITVTEKTNGEVKIYDDRLTYTMKLSEMEGIHFEYFTEGMDEPFIIESEDEISIDSDKPGYLHLVIEAENAEVFACTYGKSISYRIDGVNQPTLYYRVSCTEGGYISNGETVPIGGGHYEDYFLFEIYPAINAPVFSLNTDITIELSTVPFE